MSASHPVRTIEKDTYMAVCRRSLFQAAIALPILATSGQARAEVELVDYPMAADPAVVAALRAAAAAYRMQSEVFVHVLPTAPALLVPPHRTVLSPKAYPPEIVATVEFPFRMVTTTFVAEGSLIW